MVGSGQASFPVQRVRVEAIRLGVCEEVRGPRLEVRKGKVGFDVVYHDAGELHPVLRPEVDALALENVIYRLTEIVRVHDRYEVTYLIDAIRLVQRAELIEFVVGHVLGVVDPVSGDLDGVRVQQGSKLTPQVRGAPIALTARVECGVEEPVEQRAAEASDLFVNLTFGRLYEDVGCPDLVGPVLGVTGSEREVSVPGRFRRAECDEKACPRVGSVFDEADGPSPLGCGTVRGSGGSLQLAVDT